MQLKNRVKFDFMPERVFTVDFVSYGDFAYMLYQYQKRNIVSYAMVKINQEGKLMSDPVDLDTSQLTATGHGCNRPKSNLDLGVWLLDRHERVKDFR